VHALVDVYGAAHIYDSPTPLFDNEWYTLLRSKTLAERRRWEKSFEASNYLSSIKAPVLLSGAINDPVFPLDTMSATVSAIPKGIADFTYMLHTEEIGEALPRAYRFMDAQLKGLEPEYPRLLSAERSGSNVVARVKGGLAIEKAILFTTADVTALWPSKKWVQTPMRSRTEKEALFVEGLIPSGARYWFLTVYFGDDTRVSAPVQALE
jgi:hypothetical protein